MKEERPAKDAPRKLGAGERVGVILNTLLLSGWVVFFLLGSVEGIRSGDSVYVEYDAKAQNAKPGIFEDNLRVELISDREEGESRYIRLRIEKERTWFSWAVALLGGASIFHLLWSAKVRNPGPKPEPWKPDLWG